MTRRRALSVTLSVPLLLAFSTPLVLPAIAGTESGAVIALHVQAHATKVITPCDVWEAVPCSQFVTSWPLFYPADVYLVAARVDTANGGGIGGLACGISYNSIDGAPSGGVDVGGWTTCANILWPNPSGGEYEPWPASGSGIWATWGLGPDCQRTVIGSDGVHAVAGVFYVYAYSPDIMRVVPYENPVNGPELQVDACWDYFFDYLDDLPATAGGAVQFGGGPGYNPCTDIIPVAPTTWGRLKQRFGQ